VKKTIGFYPSVRVNSAPVAAIGSAGGVLLTTAAEVTGPNVAMKESMSRWRKPTAVHDPGKVLTDLAVTLALGGDCLADAAVVRSEPGSSGMSRPRRRSRAPSASWLVTLTACWVRWLLPARPLACGRGSSPGSWALPGS